MSGVYTLFTQTVRSCHIQQQYITVGGKYRIKAEMELNFKNLTNWGFLKQELKKSYIFKNEFSLNRGIFFKKDKKMIDKNLNQLSSLPKISYL